METKEEVIKKLILQGYDEAKLLYFTKLLHQNEFNEDEILERLKDLIIIRDDRFPELPEEEFGSRFSGLDFGIWLEESSTYYDLIEM